MHRNYCASALEPPGHNYWAHALQLLKPMHLEPEFHKRSYRNGKPMHHDEESPSLAATRESLQAATKTHFSQ